MKKPRLGKEIKWDENVELPPPVVFKDELEEKIKRWSKDLKWIRRAFLEIATYGNLLLNPYILLSRMIVYWFNHDNNVLRRIEEILKKTKKEIEEADPYDINNEWTVQCKELSLALIGKYLEMINAIREFSNPSTQEIKKGIDALQQFLALMKNEKTNISGKMIENIIARIRPLVSAVIQGKRIDDKEKMRLLNILRKIEKIVYPELNFETMIKFRILTQLCGAIYVELAP